MSLSAIKNITQIKFIKDSFWTVSSHVYLSISGLVINSIIGVKYHAEGLGIFSQSFSYFILFTLIANLGIQTSAQKHASQYSTEKRKLQLIFTNSVILTALISLTFTSIIILVLNVFPHVLSSMEVFYFLKNLCFAIPFFSMNKTMNNYLAGLRFLKDYSAIRILRWTLILFGVIYISSTNESINTIPFLFIFTEIVLFFILIIRCKVYWIIPDLEWIKIHLKFGAKNSIAEFVSTLNVRFPILILGFLMGSGAAGYYTYVESFGRAILMISGAFQKNINPLFTKLWFENKKDQIEERITRLFRFSVLSILPIFIGLFGIFMVFTTIFMTQDFLELWYVLLIYFPGIGIMYLFSPFFTFLIMTGHLNWNLFRVTIFAILNVGLSILFVHFIGITGIPIAYLLCVLINLTILVQLYNRLLNLNLLKCTIYKIIRK